MKILVFLFIFSLSTVLGQKCGDTDCGKDECCLHPLNGPPRCQSTGEEGEDCEPVRNVKINACECRYGRGLYCAQKKPNNTVDGVCLYLKDVRPDRCGDLFCVNDACCLHPTDGPPRCQPVGKKGEVCETASNGNVNGCKCGRELYCAQQNPKNTEQGVCIEEKDVQPDKCGKLFCPKDTCCLHPSDGPPHCQPLGKQGEVCDAKLEVTCRCSEGLNCTQNPTNSNESVCMGPKPVTQGEQCGKSKCPEGYCCISFSNGYQYCLIQSKEGQLCSTNPSFTYTCGCVKGLECTSDLETRSPLVGICRDPNKYQNQPKKNPNPEVYVF